MSLHFTHFLCRSSVVIMMEVNMLLVTKAEFCTAEFGEDKLCLGMAGLQSVYFEFSFGLVIFVLRTPVSSTFDISTS